MTIELGGTTIELYDAGRDHSDNDIVLLHPARSSALVVDFIPVDSLPYQDLPGAYSREWIESLTWVEENLNVDTLVIGHPPGSDAKENVGEVGGDLEEPIASVQAARAAEPADDSPEMVNAVRANLEADCGEWANFEEGLPLNIEGVIRLWSTTAEATPEA